MPGVNKNKLTHRPRVRAQRVKLSVKERQAFEPLDIFSECEFDALWASKANNPKLLGQLGVSLHEWEQIKDQAPYKQEDYRLDHPWHNPQPTLYGLALEALINKIYLGRAVYKRGSRDLGKITGVSFDKSHSFKSLRFLVTWQLVGQTSSLERSEHRPNTLLIK